MYIYTCTCIRREMHIYMGCIGGLLANTVRCIITYARSHGKCVASPRLTTARHDGRQLHGKLSVYYVLDPEMSMVLLHN